jgi:hypothetical protein
VFPIAHVGRHLSMSDLVEVAPAVTLAACAMTAACAWARRAAFPLEAAQ